MTYEDRDAELLDALLAARLSGAASAPADAYHLDVPLARRLVELAAEIQPDPAFSTMLGSRLRAEAMRYRARARKRVRQLVLLAASLIILFGLLATPQVRAAVLKSLRIGSILIEPRETAPATGTPSGQPSPAALPETLRTLAGATTLEQARRELPFPIRLPAYPPDLGPPDLVYRQELDADALIMVWLEPQNAEQVRMALFILASDLFARKSEVITLEETRVDGQRAVWISGTHMLQIIGAGGEIAFAPRRLVVGNVLIWEADALTYRLESNLPLDEAVRVAESLE